jgi:hypothetical protein
MALFNARLEQTLERGEPVVMAMPEGGGKTHMPFKTGHFGGMPDFAEFLSLKMRAALVTALREVYPGGAHMIAVSDAPLHTRDLGVCPVTSEKHIEQIWADLPRLGIKDEVIVANTPRFLPENWFGTIDEGTLEVLGNIERDPVVRAGAEEQRIRSKERRTHPASLRRIILIRKLYTKLSRCAGLGPDFPDRQKTGISRPRWHLDPGPLSKCKAIVKFEPGRAFRGARSHTLQTVYICSVASQVTLLHATHHAPRTTHYAPRGRKVRAFGPENALRHESKRRGAARPLRGGR